MTSPTTIARSLSEAERQRLAEGRLDWREHDWQDHCGELDCEHCDGALIPDGQPNLLPVEDVAVRAAILAEQEGGDG